MFFGSAFSGKYVSDENYLNLLYRHCSHLTPEWELKWGEVEKRQGLRDYLIADSFVDFCEKKSFQIRGHTLVWHQNLGSWVKRFLDKSNALRVIESYVHETVTRYKGRVAHWDVVNEAIKVADGNVYGLRDSVFFSNCGIGFIEAAFVAAHAADPNSVLFYNDYGFYRGRGAVEKRRALLGLLDYLLSNNVPIHGVGLQSHIKIDGDYDSEFGFKSFISDLASFGLDIVISELDVDDRPIAKKNSPSERDFIVGSAVKRYLDICLGNAEISGIVTWGLSDKYSNFNRTLPHYISSRCLPFDDYYQPKEFWYVLRSYFK